MGSGADDLGERTRRLRAARPGARLYQAHPVIGLEQVAVYVPERLSTGRLMLDAEWRGKTREEREQAELTFFATLFERLTLGAEATFELSTAANDPVTRGALADLGDPVPSRPAVLRGRLTADAIERLVTHELDALLVERAGQLAVVVLGDWRTAGAWLEPAEAEQLQAELTAQWADRRPLAARPGARLHQVHPAIGVMRTEDGLSKLADETLGVGWLALPLDEQRERERDVLRELLAFVRERGVSTAPEPAATDALLRATRQELVVIVDAGMTVIEAWGPRQSGVWIAPDEAGALQERLMDAWWVPWQARREAGGSASPAPRDGGRVSRRARSHLVLGFSRGAFVGMLGIIFLFERVLDARWEIMLGLVIVLLAVLFTADGALRRWYERS